MKPPRALRWCAVGFGAATFLISAWHWWTFQYRTFDLAFYVQGLWLAIRGEWNVSLLGVPLLGNHVEPIVFLIAPLFAVCPHPLLLVAVQSAALATMPFTAWRIARGQGLDERASFWLALATVLMPATGFVALHEFHPEAFAAPLLLLLIEARLAGRFGRFWLWFAAVLACKENMALLLVAWGGVGMLWDWRRSWREQWHWNVAPLLAAAAWFVVCTRLITPMLNGGRVDYLALYSHLGMTGGEILGGFVHEPRVVLAALGRAIAGGNLTWGLVVPLLALPLLRPRWLLIGVPILLQHLLSWRVSEWSINFHYAAPLVPLVWIAATQTIAASRHSLHLARAVAAACFLAQCAFGPVRYVLAELPGVPLALWERAAKERFIAEVPQDASVSAAITYLPQLAKRRELYSLHHVLKGLNTLSRARYETPRIPDCVLIDYADTATFDSAAGFYHPTMRTVSGGVVPSSDRLLHDFLAPVSWRAQNVNSQTLLMRASESGSAASNGEGVTIDPSTRLLKLVWKGPLILRRQNSETASLGLELAISGERTVMPWLTLLLRGEGGEFLLPRGLCAPEEKVGNVEELWRVFAPPTVRPGRYRVRAFFTDRASPQPTPDVLYTQSLGDVTVE